MSNPLPFCGPLGAFFPSGPAEPWKPAHDAAMACRDVEDAINVAMQFLRTIRDANERWAESVRNGAASFSWDVARQFAAAYQWWLQGARSLSDMIGECQEAGYQVERADEFRAAHREVSLLPLDVDEVRRNMEALDRGEGVSLEQAISEF